MENKTISSRRFSICDKVSFVLLCALMADCCIFGAGRILMVGPISFRMLLFGLTILTAIPLMFRQWRILITNKILWAFAMWFVWLTVSTVIGIAKGNSLAIIITDLKGFAYFALLPVAMCLLSNSERTNTLMKVMMYASGVLGVVMIAHFYLYLYETKIFGIIYFWGLENKFSAISRVSATIPRLFFPSTNYLLVGCAFATYFQIKNKKLRLHLCLLTGINLVCLLMSYTRSVYLAAGVAIIVLVLGFALFMNTQAKRFWAHICLSIVAFCLILSAFGIPQKTNYLSYAIDRTLITLEVPPMAGVDTQLTETQPTETQPTETQPTETQPTETQPTEIQPTETQPTETQPTETKPVNPDISQYQKDTVASDRLRGNIQKELLTMIGKSPIVGNGLGAALQWRTSNEYFYLDLTLKMGIVGLLLYFLPLLTAGAIILKQGKEKAAGKFQITVWVCVLLGFMAFSYFNPYMNAALGVLFYCCTLAATNAVTSDQDRTFIN